MKKNLFYIRKGYAFYRQNGRGYTDKFWEAGVYTEEEANMHARSCDELRIIPVDIKEHNDTIKELISELEKCLIKEVEEHGNKNER